VLEVLGLEVHLRAGSNGIAVDAPLAPDSP